MASTGVGSEDRSVKLLGTDGGLRSQRYSQEDARRLAELGLVFARWDRRAERIICIQFLNAEQTEAPRRWLKTGTRYSYRDGQTWRHRTLPHGAVDAQLGYTAAPEIIDLRVRNLFAAPLLSIVKAVEAPIRARPAKSETACAPVGEAGLLAA